MICTQNTVNKIVLKTPQNQFEIKLCICCLVRVACSSFPHVSALANKTVAPDSYLSLAAATFWWHFCEMKIDVKAVLEKAKARRLQVQQSADAKLKPQLILNCNTIKSMCCYSIAGLCV